MLLMALLSVNNYFDATPLAVKALMPGCSQAMLYAIGVR
jgi:hypothetical protein